jgi:hypothetical protein
MGRTPSDELWPRIAAMFTGVVIVFCGWVAGFGEAILPDAKPWRNGITGVLAAVGGILLLLLIGGAMSALDEEDRGK